MPIKQYELNHIEDDIPLSSFMDEFGINPESFDVRKLRVTVEIDYAGCWYAGEHPTLCTTISYDEPCTN